jgi:predicted ArsR family transcriptional regulator
MDNIDFLDELTITDPIRDFVATERVVTVARTAAALELKPATARRHLNALAKEGFVVATGNTRARKYSIVETSVA